MFKMLNKLGKYWWWVALMILCILVNVVMDFYLPFVLSEVIDKIQSGKDVGTVALSCLKMLLVSLLSGLSAIGTCRIASLVTAHIIAVERYELYKKVGEFSTTEMNKFSVSSLVTRTTNDLTFVSTTFDLFFRYILYGPLIAILSLIPLIMMGIMPLIIAVIVAVVVMMVVIIIVIKIAIPKYRAIQSKLDKVTLVTRENLEGLRVVRAYSAEDFQEKKFEGVNDDLMKTDRFSQRALGVLMPVIQLTIGLLNTAIYAIGAYMVPGGKMKYSDIAMTSQYAASILVGFVMLVIVFVQLPRAIVCAARINEVIESPIDVIGKETSPETDVKGTIEFKNVSFAYPGAEEKVLNNISFKANKGDTIAFIGATGAGKSTLLNLMPRFFDCTEGEVLIDGINVKEYNLSDLFSKFGYVPQKGYLFHDSLVNNITIGKPNASAEQIERALSIAQAEEFVSKLPDGINYEISQGGKNVSGGQRQRLCIARAIIMEPEIFLFDDSFSALDYKTDKVLRGEIKKQCAGTTSVIVAQRVGTIVDADHIIVLDGGKMVGQGTHIELLQNCPIYKEIALSQLSQEEIDQQLADAKKSSKGGK